jgi:hypothetical protein
MAFVGEGGGLIGLQLFEKGGCGGLFPFLAFPGFSGMGCDDSIERRDGFPICAGHGGRGENGRKEHGRYLSEQTVHFWSFRSSTTSAGGLRFRAASI